MKTTKSNYSIFKDELSRQANSRFSKHVVKEPFDKVDDVTGLVDDIENVSIFYCPILY